MKIYLAKDSSEKISLPKIIKFLNSRCKYVKFEELKIPYEANDQIIEHPVTHKKYLKHVEVKLASDEYIILVTDKQYDNNYFYEEENGLIILSFFAWDYLTSLPKENGLIYLLCGMLISEVIPRNIDHTLRLGCVNDFLADKTRVDDGMKKGHLCEKCKDYIKKNPLTKRQTEIYNDIKTLLKELSACSKDDKNIITHKNSTHEPVALFVLDNQKKFKKTSVENGASIFISYSHKDEKDLKKLEDHLKILQRTGKIRTWTDRNISAGEEWKDQIHENLAESQIILMLISTNFIASDYCYDIEMNTALERHHNNEAVAIPIIIRDCLWQVGPFAKLQALPTDGKPVQNFKRRDEAYTSIARAIYNIIEKRYNT